MANVPLSFVCGLYDRMLPLYTGEVKVADVDLDFVVEENPRAIFDLMAGSDQHDAAEMSSSEYISQTVHKHPSRHQDAQGPRGQAGRAAALHHDGGALGPRPVAA